MKTLLSPSGQLKKYGFHNFPNSDKKHINKNSNVIQYDIPNKRIWYKLTYLNTTGHLYYELQNITN